MPGAGHYLRFGSRGSALALAQTRLAIDRLRQVHPDADSEIAIVRTEGDLDKVSPLAEIGGRGVFTSALEAAILRQDVDAAVHSAKDLPSVLHLEVPIVAFPDRDDPRDVLISRHGTTLDGLPANPVIGTSSRRREAQIRQLRPDARVVSIRGNIDTRLRQAAGTELDAIVLAAAGLRRMGWSDGITEYFAVDRLVPSPGQGAIAVQARDGSRASVLLAAIDEPAVSAAVTIERAFLAAVGAGCTYPVGAYVMADSAGFRLLAMLADPAGICVVRGNELLAVGDEPEHAAEIACRMAAEVGLDRGFDSWTGSAAAGRDLDGVRVVVTRPRRQADPLIAALKDRGASVLALPTIRIEPAEDATPVDTALVDLHRRQTGWIAFTSANAVQAVADRLAALAIHPAAVAAIDVAAVGSATAAAARCRGFRVKLIPERASAEELAAALRERLPAGSHVLYPHSAIGRAALQTGLRDAGINVTAVAAYRTVRETSLDPSALERVRRGEVDVITFASPSSVHALVTLLGPDAQAMSFPAICVGAVTAAAAREAGFAVVATSDDPDARSLTDTIANWWRQQLASANPQIDMAMTGVGRRSAEG